MRHAIMVRYGSDLAEMSAAGGYVSRLEVSTGLGSHLKNDSKQAGEPDAAPDQR